MGTKDWKEIEKLAAVIEKHLDPDATVRHNVRLLDLTDPTGESKRQCDIVIETGPAHSRTRTIAEVQSRDRKPTINDFGGWLGKMRDVGAQHLLCISEKGFPESIVKKAATWGPSVRLVTLTAVEAGSWALAPLTSTVVTGLRYDRLVNLKTKLAHSRIVRTRTSLGPLEKIFRVQERHVVSATDILDYHFFSKPNRIDEIPEGITTRVQIRFPKGSFEYQAPGAEEWYETEYVMLVVDVNRFSVRIEWGAVEYVQHETLGWIMRGKMGPDDAHSVDVVAPVMHLGNGVYKIGRPQILSQTETAFFLHAQGDQPQTMPAASFDETFGGGAKGTS